MGRRRKTTSKRVLRSNANNSLDSSRTDLDQSELNISDIASDNIDSNHIMPLDKSDKYVVPDEIELLMDSIELWELDLPTTASDTEKLKSVRSAIRNSKHYSKFSHILNETTYDKLKNRLKDIFDDNLKMIFSPTKKDPRKAYLFIEKNFPNLDRDRQIEILAKHVEPEAIMVWKHNNDDLKELVNNYQKQLDNRRFTKSDNQQENRSAITEHETNLITKYEKLIDEQQKIMNKLIENVSKQSINNIQPSANPQPTQAQSSIPANPPIVPTNQSQSDPPPHYYSVMQPSANANSNSLREQIEMFKELNQIFNINKRNADFLCYYHQKFDNPHTCMVGCKKFDSKMYNVCIDQIKRKYKKSTLPNYSAQQMPYNNSIPQMPYNNSVPQTPYNNSVHYQLVQIPNQPPQLIPISQQFTNQQPQQLAISASNQQNFSQQQQTFTVPQQQQVNANATANTNSNQNF